MTSHPLIDNGYIPPLCSLIYLDAEVDVCTGTDPWADTPGADGYDDEELDDLT